MAWQVLLKFGELSVHCNERFEAAFIGTDDCRRAMRHSQLRPEYFWSR
jgi:hypothetical protein